MSSNASVNLEANAAGVFRELLKMQQEFKKTTSETDRWGRLAKKVIEDSLTPLDKYNRKMDELRHLLVQGHIDLKQFNSAADKLKTTLDDTKIDNSALTIEQSAIHSVIQYASTIGGIRLAWEAVKKAAADARQEQIDAGQRQEDSVDFLGELANVVSGKDIKEKQQDLANIKAQSAKYLAEGTFKDGTLNDAYELMFNIRSAGFDQNADMFAAIGKARVTQKPADYVKNIKMIQSGFGIEEAGGAEAVASKLGYLATKTLETPDALAPYMAKLGSAALGIKMSDEQAGAAYAIGSSSLGKEESKTAIYALLSQVKMHEIPGNTWDDIYKNIEESKAQGKKLTDIIGQNESALKGYDVISRYLKDINAFSSELDKENKGTWLKERIALGAMDVDLSTNTAKNKTTGETIEYRIPVGQLEQTQQTIGQTMDSYRERFQAQGGMTRSVDNMFNGAFDFANRLTGGNGLYSGMSLAGLENFINVEKRWVDPTNKEQLEVLLRLESLMKQAAIQEEALLNRSRPPVPKPEQ